MINIKIVSSARLIFSFIRNIKKARSLVKTQGTDGNWNYDSYMLGMYNGMELILAVMENREPVYRDKKK